MTRSRRGQVSKLQSTETERLLNLEESMSKRFVDAHLSPCRTRCVRLVATPSSSAAVHRQHSLSFKVSHLSLTCDNHHYIHSRLITGSHGRGAGWSGSRRPSKPSRKRSSGPEQVIHFLFRCAVLLEIAVANVMLVTEWMRPRSFEPGPPDRELHVPRADGRGQDAAREDALRAALQRRVAGASKLSGFRRVMEDAVWFPTSDGKMQRVRCGMASPMGARGQPGS